MPDDVPTQRFEDEPDFSDMPTARAPDCAIVFHDDPETPADFVLFLLERYCGLGEEQARNVVQEITTRGKAVATVLPERLARIKFSQIEEAAKSKFPFKASLESLDV
jgi:ATP-dependent Clp protease adapter protein ClpS